MPNYTEKVQKLSLPVIPMRGIVAFPSIPMSFELVREVSVNACNIANEGNGLVFLSLQKDIKEESVSTKDLHKVGTVAKIKQSVKLQDSNLRIIVEASARATVLSYYEDNGTIYADVICKTVNVEDNGGVHGEALMREAHTTLGRFVKYLPKASNELVFAARSIKNPGLLADFAASNFLVKPEDKQLVLSEFDPLRRLELLAVIMESELEILDLENKIHKKVKSQLEQNQREYYLREQLRIIQNELGAVDGDNEIDEYYSRIYDAKLPLEIEEKLIKEVKKLAKTPFGAAEGSVIRNYIDTCLEIPWTKKTKDRLDIKSAKKILDADHDGLNDVKDRILEFLSVKQNSPDLKNQILCLVGPPGVGKTSIVSSIARAMNRKYVRVSLGGVRDESDIRGHRKTYVASMPGRIISALIKAKKSNPIILLDEIDKMTANAQGDPASALLEVLDSEQNKAFRDHFVEMPFDLSECMFIATANTLSTVARPLIDRMEIIKLDSYTENEKKQIAKNHLVPKQLKRHGLTKRQLKISDGALSELINYYTKESGVRNLEREIASLCRKTARKLVGDGLSGLSVTENNIRELLGHRKFKPDVIEKEDIVGVVNGLAYTELGGEMLQVEVSVIPGSGKIELTGSLGDVMKESARIAVSFVRSVAEKLKIDKDFYKNNDIHIHVPEGATPKDGPSAGVTLVTALVSALTGYPVRHDVAMTGEVTLRGRVLAIGGLKEKTAAAYGAGVKTVLIPADNVDDLEDIDPTVRENINFIACLDVNNVIKEAIIFDEKVHETASEYYISDLPQIVSDVVNDI